MVKKVIGTCQDCGAENSYLKNNLCSLCGNKDIIKKCIDFINLNEKDKKYIFTGIKPNENIYKIVEKVEKVEKAEIIEEDKKDEEIKEPKKKYFKCEYCLYITSRNEKGKAMIKEHRQKNKHIKNFLEKKKIELDEDEAEYLFNNCAFHLNSGNTYEKRLKILNKYNDDKYIKENNLCWSDACQEWQQPTEFNIRKNYIINNLI